MDERETATVAVMADVDAAVSADDPSDEVTLSGQLVCKDDVEVALVRRYLLRHVELTLAEPGCVSFDVVPTADERVWQVAERFVDAAAFEAHQHRAAASDWGRVTAGIQRNFRRSGGE